jgi:hypothetical protein
MKFEKKQTAAKLPEPAGLKAGSFAPAYSSRYQLMVVKETAAYLRLSKSFLDKARLTVSEGPFVGKQ